MSFIGRHVCCRFRLTLKSHGSGLVWYWLTNGFCLYGNLGIGLLNTSRSCLFSPLSSRAHVHSHTHTHARTRRQPHIQYVLLVPAAIWGKPSIATWWLKFPHLLIVSFLFFPASPRFISLFLFSSFLDSSFPSPPIRTAPIFFLFAAVINVTSGHECFSATCNFDGDATVPVSFWEAECRPNCAVPAYPPPCFNTEDKETECQCVWKAAITGMLVYVQ